MLLPRRRRRRRRTPGSASSPLLVLPISLLLALILTPGAVAFLLAPTPNPSPSSNSASLLSHAATLGHEKRCGDGGRGGSDDVSLARQPRGLSQRHAAAPTAAGTATLVRPTEEEEEKREKKRGAGKDGGGEGRQAVVGKGSPVVLEIREATMADTRALVDFVLKCEGEWFGAGHAKKEGLNARLQFHLSNGVLVYMAFDAASPQTLVGIYASTAIDHMTIPRLPLSPSSLLSSPPSSSMAEENEEEEDEDEGEDEGGREGGHPFPSVSQTCPRRFLSDVKVIDSYKRKGVATSMLLHFQATEQTLDVGHEGVLACLFVTKDNPAGLRLYEKAGYLPVQCDLKRKRFRPLLEAGAIHEDDLEGVVFMCKYIKPLVGKAGGGGREGMRQGQGEQGGGRACFIDYHCVFVGTGMKK